MPRFATIDIGTNSVLLLVAERGPDGRFHPIAERADITRLGRGVDRTRTLSPEGMEDTLRVLEAYAAEARTLGAQGLAVSATSAARDAHNGADFLAAARQRAGVEVEILSGDEEARLSFASAHADFGGGGPLVAIDIGGGSTEFIYGGVDGTLSFRRSFDVGAVRLTERFLHGDPPAPGELAALRAQLEETFSALPPPPAGATVVGVAGTVTTLYAVQHAVEPYDAARVHGGTLTRAELASLVQRLCAMPVAERRALPGLQPKRADVIPAGGLILLTALERLGAEACRVSDRGLRWGLLASRFGQGRAS